MKTSSFYCISWPFPLHDNPVFFFSFQFHFSFTYIKAFRFLPVPLFISPVISFPTSSTTNQNNFFLFPYLFNNTLTQSHFSLANCVLSFPTSLTTNKPSFYYFLHVPLLINPVSKFPISFTSKEPIVPYTVASTFVIA